MTNDPGATKTWPAVLLHGRGIAAERDIAESASGVTTEDLQTLCGR